MIAVPPRERPASPATAEEVGPEEGDAVGARNATSRLGAVTMLMAPPVSASHVSTRACAIIEGVRQLFLSGRKMRKP